ncbi:MAG: hypothetical protein KME12_23585 [Trichocoleus desertorum ATA4-8-CV12]|nr:hypothetical protein [Trichocoleus desertorum ATA4-8-CV12]
MPSVSLGDRVSDEIYVPDVQQKGTRTSGRKPSSCGDSTYIVVGVPHYWKNASNVHLVSLLVNYELQKKGRSKAERTSYPE